MKKNNPFLMIVEILVMGGILFALISPLFSPEEEEEHSQFFPTQVLCKGTRVVKNSPTHLQ